jgi:hypothetical protein
MNGNSEQDDLADRIVARLEASFQAMLREAIAADRMERQQKSKPVITSDLIRHGEAVDVLGSRGILQRCIKAGWITAVVKRKRLTLYKRNDVLAAVEKIAAGDLP